MATNNTINNIEIKKEKCPTCENPIDRNGWYCSACCNKLKLLNRSKAQERRLAGLCVQCGRIVHNYIYCQVCRDARMARYWAKKNKV